MYANRLERLRHSSRARTRAVVVGLLSVAVLVGAAIAIVPAAPASPGAGDPRVTALVKQVKLLQAQVNALKKQDSQQWDEIGAGWASQDCLGAQVADLIQGTWGVIDEIGQAAQATYFGPQTQVPDYGSCESFSRPAVPRVGIQRRPTIDPLASTPAVDQRVTGRTRSSSAET